MSTNINLYDLPAPSFIDVKDYETILAEIVSDFKACSPDYGDLLESDPVMKILEVAAYREYYLRQEFNDNARASLLAYAIGDDLDHRAAEKNIVRKENETDADLRLRVQLAPEGYSVAGPKLAYKSHALNSDDLIKDAKAISPEEGRVLVSILSHEGDGTASADLITKANTYISDEDRRPLTDHVIVQSAEIISYNVTATLTFYNGPDRAVALELIQSAVSDYTASQHQIGEDITLSGLYSALHGAGVQKVELTEPLSNIHVSDTQAAYCTNIILNDGGVYDG